MRLVNLVIIAFQYHYNCLSYTMKWRLTTPKYYSTKIDKFSSVFSVAPMMDYTDRYQRTLMRMITKKATLYTEMLTANAIVKSANREKLLDADLLFENPLVLQLGGSDPYLMGEAAKIAYSYGYREFNINCGCPSAKVESGSFGASLMANPSTVADIVNNIADKCGIIPTIKCRIGIDDKDSYEDLHSFVDHVSTYGQVKHFIVHARKAILNMNLTPEQNRKIPPLKYHYVYQLTRDFPVLSFTLNGGIEDMSQACDHLRLGVHGVMVGRGVIHHPYRWRHVDEILYDNNGSDFNTPTYEGVQNQSFKILNTRRDILDKYCAFVNIQEKRERNEEYDDKRGVAGSRSTATKPILDLFKGEVNGKRFRQLIDEELRSKRNDRHALTGDMIMRASECLSDEVLDAI